MKKGIIAFLTIGLLISGCDKENNNSTSNNSSPNSFQSSISENTSSSSTSSVFEGYKDIDVVLSNSRYYGIRYSNMEERYVEINLKNMYYNTFSSTGYVVLDNDPDYLHAFTTYYDLASDNYDLCMDVHGRTTNKENITQLEDRNLLHILVNYYESMEQVRDNIYKIASRDLCYELSNFFQTKGLRYCTLIELTVGKNNKIESLLAYEESTFPVYSRALVMDCRFDYFDREDVGMYDKWIKAGSVVNERIVDYKMLTNDGVSVYNNENKKFEATVVSKDSDGNIYVAQEAKNKENIGIKVTPSNDCSNLNVGDIVTVEGKMTTNKSFVVSVVDAEIKDTGKDADFPPIFDEEVIVDNYGGGAYAATYFSNVPYYSGSVYSTYAYVLEIPENLNENGDTTITVVCPSYQSEEYTYQMKVILPASLSLAQRSKIFSEMKNAGIYNEEGCYELSLEKFVIEFDVNYFYGVKLLATSYTDTTRKLNAQEKVEKYVGLANFPIIEGNDSVSSYRFGGSSGYYLETQYAKEGKATHGVYIGYARITGEDLNNFMLSLETINATLYDIIKDGYSGKHYIYKVGNTNIDIQYMLGSTGADGTLNIWVYNGELLRTPTINERLQLEIGSWFNVDDFEVLEGTYDYDYTIFKLIDYANNSYTVENPLYCVTIDTQENIRDAFGLQLVQKGYTQYMENNFPYTYRTRGQEHYVFTKGEVFVDIACYPTTDYTYAGHDEYEYRLEVLIYKGSKPLSIKTYENLDFLSDLYAAIDPSLAYSPVLPEDAVVEIWRDLEDFRLSPVEYGYGCRDEAFIYTSDVDGCYDAIKEAMVAAGYRISSERKMSVSFTKTVNGTDYYAAMFKEPEKGYVRFMNDVLGVDFTR